MESGLLARQWPNPDIEMHKLSNGSRLFQSNCSAMSFIVQKNSPTHSENLGGLE